MAAGVGLPGDAGGPGVIDVAVYDTNGHLDPSFDADGMLVSAPEVDNGAWGGVIAQPDGKVVIGGNPGARPLHGQRRPRPHVRHRPKRSRDRDRWRERPRPPAGRKTRHGGIPERAFGHGCQLRDRAFQPLGLARQIVPRRRGDDRLWADGTWRRPSPFSRTAGSSSAARPNGSTDGITQSGDFALARYLGVPELPGAERDRQDTAGCEGADRACELPARTGRTQDVGQGCARAYRVPTARRRHESAERRQGQPGREPGPRVAAARLGQAPGAPTASAGSTTGRSRP